MKKCLFTITTALFLTQLTMAQDKKEVYFTGKYLFTNSAITLNKSEQMFAWNIFGPQYYHGITDNLQVGITTTWLLSPIVLEASGAYSFTEKLHVGINGIWGVEWVDTEASPASLISGTVTWGDRSSNLSGSIYGIQLNPDGSDSGKFFSLSGYHKLSNNRAAFVESYFVDISSRDVGFLFVPGVQFLTKRNRMLNVGIVNIIYEDVYILVPIPFLQLQVPF